MPRRHGCSMKFQKAVDHMWRAAKKMAMVSTVVGAAMALAPALQAQQFVVGGSGDPSIEIDLSVIEGGGTSVVPAPRTPRLLFPGARLKPDEAVVLRPLPPGARKRIISTTLSGRGHVHSRARRPALRLKLPSTRSLARTPARTPQLQLRPPSSVTGLRFPLPRPRITLRKPAAKAKKSAKPRRKVMVKRAKPAKTKSPRRATVRAKAKAPPRVMTRKVATATRKPTAKKKPPARKRVEKKHAKKTARQALPPLKPVSPPPMKTPSKPLITSPVKVAKTPPPPKPAKKIPKPLLAAPPPPPDISKPTRLARSAPAKMPKKTIKPRKTIKKAAPPPPPPPSGQQTAKLAPAAPSIAPGTALRIPFPGNVAKLPKQATAALQALAQRLAKDSAIRLQLKAYASGTKDNASRARRLSLSRALAVRSYLIRLGVRAARIDVRALGNKAEGQPANRVDLIVVSR